ncbi:MAG: C39 family peptidase [bacterium]|nr:C39 family peptidase [bacterium]
MKLDVPLVQQKEDSVDCGIAVVTMILNYYGVQKSFEEIKREIPTDQVGTYAPQLGSFLVEQGFIVDIVTRNPLVFTKAHEGATKEETIKRFEELKAKGEKETAANFFLQFLAKDRASVTVKIPSKQDIEDEVKAGRPLVAFLTNAALYKENLGEKYGKDFTYTFHSVVISGIEDNKVVINDPYWGEEGGVQEYQLEEFLYSLYTGSLGDLDNGCLIKIKKRE